MWETGERRAGEQGDHVDTLDVFGAGAEVGVVVDFVFEELLRGGELGILRVCFR